MKTRAQQIVKELIEFQKGPEELTKLVRYKVTGGRPPDPPESGKGGGGRFGGNSRGLSWHEMLNGDLEIVIDDPVLQAAVKETVQGGNTSDSALADVLEPATTNGLHWVRPEEVGALTDSPMLGDVAYDDSGDITEIEKAKIWWYPDYQVRSPLEDLAEQGRTIFKSAGSTTRK